jgi:aminomethyltransferase
MMLCQEDGRIIEDLVVARLDAGEFLVVCNTSNVDRVQQEINDRGRRFAARVDDRTDDYAVVGVEGPRAAAIAGKLTPIDVRSLKRFGTAETTLAGRNGLLARSGYTGEDGFDFYCAPDDAAAVWYALHEAGTPFGIRPVGLSTRDVLRLEAGIPLCGRELTSRVTPYDAGLPSTVALGKRDFVGRAALAKRAEAEDQIRLVGLLGTGPRSPRAGSLVVDADTGRPVGRVTSGAPSPTLGRPIAMAYLHLDELAAAGDLAVPARGQLLPVEVTSLPFRRNRRL